nr:hypothetical protein [uncultured Mucilaginibacter sp.]
MNLNATEYRNASERFPELQKKILIRSAVFVPLVLIFSVAIFLFSGDQDFAGSLEIPIVYLLFIFAVLAFSIFRNLKLQRDIYQSYKFTIDTDCLLREQSNLAPVKIDHNDIAEIIEDNSGSLIIKGAQAQQIIVISPFIENPDQLKSSLRSVHPISELKAQNIIQKYPMIMPLLMVVSMLTAYFCPNKIIAAIGGIISLLMMMWSFYKIRTAPVMDNKTKRLSWWLVIIFISMIATVYFKLFPLN